MESLTPVYNLNNWTKSDSWQTLDGYRLPTGAEWEYAARGGSTENIYAGGDTIKTICWYWDNSNESENSQLNFGHGSFSVGGKKGNGFNLYDLSGNIQEFCWDIYAINYYSVSPKNNPTGAASGNHKVLRGGSWHSPENECRVYARDYAAASAGSFKIGFRVVRSR